jgi:DNA-binding response OmpR family regulator
MQRLGNAVRSIRISVISAGYTRNAIVHNGVLDSRTQFLPKPFAVDELAAKVRFFLDGY